MTTIHDRKAALTQTHGGFVLSASEQGWDLLRNDGGGAVLVDERTRNAAPFSNWQAGAFVAKRDHGVDFSAPSVVEAAP